MHLLLGPPALSGRGSRSLCRPCLLFPRMWVLRERNRAQEGLRPAWNPECTNLFPALVMVSPARPGNIPGAEHLALGCLCLEPAVSAQPRLGSVRWASLAKSISSQPPSSCSHNDTSATTSSILVHMEPNMAVSTLRAGSGQTPTPLLQTVIRYLAACLSECLMRIFMHFAVVSG